MIHLGDITKLRGSEVPIVDVITGGSPCQDLSVAGKRAGLEGERSGLFMEQIRLIKEMREHDRNNGRTGMYVRPRYCIWENVPGALSSSGKGLPKGSDFQAVLTEFARVADPEAPDVPMPEKGKWPKSGCLYDEMGRWSIAWRVHDAQFWGVPQRRKRIALVADFGGLSAPEILFERKGLSGDFEPGGEKRQGAADRTEESADDAISFQERAGCPGGGKGILIQNERTGALSTLNNQSVLAFAQNQRDEVRDLKGVAGVLAAEPGMKQQTFIAYGISSYDSNAMKSPNPHSGIYEADTSRTLDLNGGNPACNQGGMAVVSTYAWCRSDRLVASDVGCCQNARQHKSATDLVVCAVDSNKNGFVEMAGTLQAREKAGGYQDCVSIGQSIVRRLTPLECERLQGFPDNWTDSKGKLHKAADSPRYKALGNSIALPFWQYLARRICAQYERPVTMASLFDGIGGFPLVFERCGAKAVWASEIEEFPMAVTKARFGDK